MPAVVLNWTLLKKGMDVTTRCAEKPGHQASLTGCRQAVKIADANRMDALSYPWNTTNMSWVNPSDIAYQRDKYYPGKKLL